MRAKLKNRCLTDEEIALYIEEKSEYCEYNSAIRHLAMCEECLDKTVEINRLVNIKQTKVPHGLSEKAFMKVLMRKEKMISLDRSVLKKGIASLAIAASVLVVIMLGISHYQDNNKPVMQEFSSNKEVITIPVDKSAIPKRILIERDVILGSNNDLETKLEAKIPLTQEQIKDNHLVNAGYLYFLLRNSQNPNRNVIDKLLTVLDKTRIPSKNTSVLIEQGWYDLFLKEVSHLSTRERTDFAEGYIYSYLYHTDNKGKIYGSTLEWGEKLALAANSMAEIKQRMLYPAR